MHAGVRDGTGPCETVFKWQEPFWEIMKEVFDDEFKTKFVDAKIMAEGAELTHFLSDAATMKLVVWTDGGFGMAAHNYDGDVLTDELAQVHMSPGFITSNLVGVDANGTLIKAGYGPTRPLVSIPPCTYVVAVRVESEADI